MNESRAICPQCKREVVFQAGYAAISECPACGFKFKRNAGLGPEKPNANSDWNAFLKPLIKAMLIIAALLVVVALIVFAGCSVLLGK
jgi:hypothetical protein